MSTTSRKEALVAGLLWILLSPPVWASKLAGDEHVMFLPGTARVLDKVHLEVVVEAWVHEIESRPGANALFARYLRLDLERMSPAERALYEQRTQLFRVDSERGKALQLRFADGSLHTLPRSAANGRSSARINIAASSSSSDRWLSFELLDEHSGITRPGGRALLVPTHGISVISDIDDTIKDSQVRNRRELLLNTFTRPFHSASGMAQRYRELEQHDAATRFHYLSSSPIQLYPPLADFLQDEQFPDGSVHLRETTSLRGFAKRGASRRHKQGAITQLLKDFPHRRFVLIGDSGEADPEIYADFAREYPEQVIAIAIRNVSNENASSARYTKTFAGIPRAIWTVFDDPGQWIWPPPSTK